MNSTPSRACGPVAALDRRHHKPLNPVAEPPATPDRISQSSQSSGLHLECRLPINLREFLANYFGAAIDSSDDTVLKMAATADEATLSRVARAIRRYSTTRAQQSWEEVAIPLARLVPGPGAHLTEMALCLRCLRVELGAGALGQHQTAGCISLALHEGHAAETVKSDGPKLRVADHVRRRIEEFRALRVAFGLPHFELDSYVRNDHMVFTWRPLS